MNLKSYSPSHLQFVVCAGHIDTIEQFLEATRNTPSRRSALFHQDANGLTLLHHAAEACNAEMFAILLREGVNPNQQDNHGRTAWSVLPSDLANDIGTGKVIIDRHADVPHDPAPPQERQPISPSLLAALPPISIEAFQKNADHRAGIRESVKAAVAPRPSRWFNGFRRHARSMTVVTSP